MAELLSLRGRNALSSFRVAKLLSSLTGTRVAAVAAVYWHFVELRMPLTAAERATLDRLLTYGPRDASDDDAGELLLVRAASGHDLAVGVEGHRHRAQLRPRRGRAHRARHRLSDQHARRRSR